MRAAVVGLRADLFLHCTALTYTLPQPGLATTWQSLSWDPPFLKGAYCILLSSADTSTALSILLYISALLYMYCTMQILLLCLHYSSDLWSTLPWYNSLAIQSRNTIVQVVCTTHLGRKRASPYGTTLYYNTLCWATLHYTAQNCTALHCSLKHYITL